jgi:hypothetical protein
MIVAIPTARMLAEMQAACERAFKEGRFMAALRWIQMIEETLQRRTK